LENELGRTRKLLKLPYGTGLHSLRHTRLTELARTTDAFTLQRIAGHSNISTTMKYVHVQQEAISDAFSTSPASRGKSSPQNSPQAADAEGTMTASD
jgi:integrase